MRINSRFIDSGSALLGKVLTADGAGKVTWSTPPGAGGGTTVNSGTASVNFGAGKDDFNAVTTVAASWVTPTSKIQCQVDTTSSTVDHDPDDAVVEGLTAYPQNIVNGVSFDIAVSAPNGTFGTYNVNYFSI